MTTGRHFHRFDIKEYKLLNSDLQTLTDAEAAAHFLHKGRYQNRFFFFDLPDDWDANAYRLLNWDLRDYDDLFLKKHYTWCGRKERRKCSWRNTSYSLCQNFLPFEKSYLSQVPKVWIFSNNFYGGTEQYTRNLILRIQQEGIPCLLLPSRAVFEEWRSCVLSGRDRVVFQNAVYGGVPEATVLSFALSHSLPVLCPVHDLYFFQSDWSSFGPESTLHCLDPGQSSCSYEQDKHLRPTTSLPASSPLIPWIRQPTITFVFPSQWLLQVFETVTARFRTCSLVYSPPIDLGEETRTPPVPLRLAWITELSIYKGKRYLFQWWAEGPLEWSGVPIQFFVFTSPPEEDIPLRARSYVFFVGPYGEEENVGHLVSKYDVHGFLFLNEYPETWSFAFTKALRTELPILYSKHGALEERVNAMSLSATEKKQKYFPFDSSMFSSSIVSFLEHLVLHTNRRASSPMTDEEVSSTFMEEHHPDTMTPSHSTRTMTPPFYEQWISDLSSSGPTTGSCATDRNVPSASAATQFAIYFPQFYSIQENDQNFFKGYTDMKGLHEFRKKYQSREDVRKRFGNIPILSPEALTLGWYDMHTDQSWLHEKQVQLARAFGIHGFAVYFYWFSTNTITREPLIFRFAMDLLERISFPLFFLWANENWSNNPAFTQYEKETSKEGNDDRPAHVTFLIENDYSEASLTTMFTYLCTRWFCRPNYVTKNGKPLFGIHHPFLVSEAQHKNILTVGTRVAQSHHFLGIEWLFNDMTEVRYPEGSNYLLHPNYKKNTNNVVTIDPVTQMRTLSYPKYVSMETDPSRESHQHSVIPSLFPYFNNAPRFCRKLPRMFEYCTMTSGYDRSLVFQWMMEVLRRANSSPHSLLFLNSWNEWGEQMAFEPSNEFGFDLLFLWKQAVFLSRSSKKSLGKKEEDDSVVVSCSA